MPCGHLLGKGWSLGSHLWWITVFHFPIGILGQVWYLIVSILSLCTLIYLGKVKAILNQGLFKIQSWTLYQFSRKCFQKTHTLNSISLNKSSNYNYLELTLIPSCGGTLVPTEAMRRSISILAWKRWKNTSHNYHINWYEPKHEILVLKIILVLQWCFYLCILHFLRIILSPRCKVFISASPRMQWYCRLVMKNSVLDSKVCSLTHWYGKQPVPGPTSPKL